LADRITSIHGIKGNTAVRATAGTVHKYAGVSKLYSFYQFLAIASHILPSARLADLGFNATIAIQSSAFMMTLYRKRIVRGRTHMIVYSLCLVLSGFHIVRLLGLFSSALVAACFLLRINLPREWSNKYVCWTLFLAAYNYQYIYQVYIQGLNVEELVELPTAKGTFLACMLYALYISERRVNQNAPSTTN
jgi:hypothetical protein